MLERGRIHEGSTGLTQHGRLVLYALLTLERQGETPVQSRDVRSRYTNVAEQTGVDPLVTPDSRGVGVYQNLVRQHTHIDFAEWDEFLELALTTRCGYPETDRRFQTCRLWRQFGS
ncbi:hypothetical protein NDI85_18490 [Halomicroarcula sp. S1AR25-4]|nr:hypothetical protein [Halomicroarcula sp. S1AR25-4]